jgi:hypothetical protein
MLIEPLMPLPLFRNVSARPELSLYAEIVFDAVRDSCVAKASWSRRRRAHSGGAPLDNGR